MKHLRNKPLKDHSAEAMASQEFTVLYTHQKMKKSKTWQDGILRIRPGENRAILLDDKGQYLESMFVKSQVKSGDNLESERYLIMVEEAKMKEKSCGDQPRKPELVDVNRRGLKPAVLPPRHLSVGLKRKFTGFQGPRQVEKKVSTAEDGERMAVSPISEQSQDPFPSRFYITSPLFSTIYKKNAETSLSADLHEDGGTDNRDRVTPSSMVSLPFLHACNEIEKKNSDQSMVKPESPLISGHTKSSSWTTGHGAVSQNIRSTAQIIALLKSKPQVCGEQATSEVTECHRFQALENINSLYNLKSTTLPAFSVNSDKKIAQNIQHLPFTKEMVNDKKERLLINSSEPCDKEITGQRQNKKANSLGQDLQDSCRTNSSVLSESTINRVSDSLFVSPCSASPVTFEKPLSRYREHLAINGLQDNSSIKSQSDLQLKQNSERMPSDLELSEDVTVTEKGIAKQELSTCDGDCSPDKQVMEVNFDLLGAFDFHDMDNGEHCEGNKKELTEEDMLSESADCLEGEDRAQNTALRFNSCFEVMTHCKKEEIKCSTYDVEKDGNHCTVQMPLQFCNNVTDTERIMEDSSNQTKIEVELLDDRNNLKEINGSLGSTEAVNNKKDLGGCAALTINGTSGIKSKHFDLFPSDTNVKCHPKTGMFDKTENISCTASSIISTAEEKTEEDVIQLECTKSPDLDLEHFWGTKIDYIKPDSPMLTLAQNSESCCGSSQYITEDHQNLSGILNKESTLISRSAICPLGKGRSASEEAEMDETEFENLESMNVPLGAYKGERIEMDCLKSMAKAENSSDLPDLKTELCIPLKALGQRDPRTPDCQWKSPDSRSLHEDNMNFMREENFQKKFNIKDSVAGHSSPALNACSEVPQWIVSSSPSRSDLGETQWTSWEPGKIIPSVQLNSSVSPASGKKGSVQDIQEPLIYTNLPSDSELPENIFTWEQDSYPEECNSTVKTQIPPVTVAATEKIPNNFFLTDSEEVQQSNGFLVASLSSKPAAFSMSASGPEDRNYETSVFEECTEDRQRKSVHPVFSNVTSQYRQSKWVKYLNSAHCDLITQNSNDMDVTNDIYAENVLGMLPGDTGESQSSTVNSNAPGSVPLLTAKSMLGECCAGSTNQDLISERKLLSCHLNQTPLTEPAQKVLSHLTCCTVTGDVQDITVSELSFPNADKVKHANLPKRKIAIPTEFQSHVHYKQVFKAALTEHLNIMLFELSQRFHNALSKVDTSFYTSLKDEQSESKESCVPLCDHMRPAKVLVVKKEGQNKGRLFYACDAPRAERCSFFKWVEEVNPAQIKKFTPSVVLHDVKSIGAYLRNQKIFVFDGCQLFVRKGYEIRTRWCSKLKKLKNMHAESDGDSKNKLYLKLSSKEHYSLYSKDDIWVVSKTLNFDPLDTFIASSAFFGPTHNNEVELLPLKGYYPSNWHSHTSVHALLACNASGELISLRNMEEYFNPSTLPLIPYLLKMNRDSEKPSRRINRRKFIPPAMSVVRKKMYGSVSSEVAMQLAEKMILTFSLNPDQATSLIHIAQMMSSHENMKSVEEHHIFPITIIHGVFGAGKSYLLSVVILFLVQLFESSEAKEGPELAPWKLLIASSTNVAVDRILLCLLDLGFEDFIRVGSIRKIAKAILPRSLHAGSGNENEQLKELLALMKEDLAPAEKMYVRKSIERHKLGTNKNALQQVKVVGVTCAACPFPCLDTLQFPVVVLDECSQMTEPTSLLPIARFQCEKLVLVGDPKQLPPTIQGSESIHDKGLEQTLFDRLCLMGHKTILLRTQYRCHPAISAIANELFYEGNLIDGISEKERSPLLDWLPTLCFYSVSGLEQIESDNSFYNTAEVHFIVKLIQSLIASGIHGSAVGVITFYKSQMYKIQNLLRSVHSEAFPVKAVQVSTVDAFQGAEKEIVVLSCVRTRQTGFTDSEKRMNVALTRAKRHLLIVGNLACLSKNRLYERVINHCKGQENGLQHVSQCEQQLNDILKYYLEEKKEEEQSKKKEK
ncbi:protein ZGRF1 [Tympanuchus pallidicinctus]|uniref:protein ZGRF1 n=1 Tax=Tympanuchus pallidicinctus TaxID=109042 RepID=UPI002286F218|nr:protein ZGRF1 [Tympanuchus pallidicinctus]